MSTKFRTIVFFLFASLLLTSFSAFSQTPGTWVATGQLANSTENPVATLLKTGKVLVAGGDLGSLIIPIRNAQLYDPATNSWTRTANMLSPRTGHAGALLPSGQVLIEGGANGNFAPNGYDLVIQKTAELYSPATGRFIATGRMSTARMYHVSTLLPNGKILVTGGYYLYKPRLRYAVATTSAELFDPAAGTWSSAGSMSIGRAFHSATVLQSGKVLVVGSGTADLYDPSTNTWTPTAAPISKSTGNPSVLLASGKVLSANPLGTAELYDPSTGAWSQTGSMSAAHSGGMVLLPNGRALIVGAYATGTCELYDPFTGTWSATGSLISARTGAPVTLLPDGRALVTGGTPVWWNGEIYTP